MVRTHGHPNVRRATEMNVTRMIFALKDRVREACMMLNEPTRAQEVTRFPQFSISKKLFLPSTFVSSVFSVAPLFELWVMHSHGGGVVHPVSCYESGPLWLLVPFWGNSLQQLHPKSEF